MALEAAPNSRSAEKRFRWEEEVHQLDSGVNVELNWSLLHPKRKTETIHESSESEKVGPVVYLTGWGDTRLESQGELTQAFADSSQSDAYILSLRSRERGQTPLADGPDFLYEEARAAAKFIQSKKLTNVTLVGYSQGAPRAINVAHIIERGSDTPINGIVLMAPVGLYEQDPIALMGRFGWHTGPELKGIDVVPGLGKIPAVKNMPDIHGMLGTAPEAAKTAQKQGESDVAETLAEEYGKAPGAWFGTKAYRWLERQRSELWEMGSENPRLGEVRAPIVMISGLSDRVASRERILPSVEEKIVREEMGETVTRDKTLAARENLLKQNIFKSSESVQWLVPTKLGGHLVNIFRPQQVAGDAMYLLRRAHRSPNEQGIA